MVSLILLEGESGTWRWRQAAGFLLRGQAVRFFS
jgi:hypothetical protein